MIENYLDFVKRKRAYALELARDYMEKSRCTTDEWCDGFYRGMKLAFEFESRHWRTLQKDMEMWLSNKDNALLPLCNVILSQNFDRYRGGKNG